jgi:hypothetical protein
MRLPVIKMLTYLVLGAIVTIAVAWWCATRAPVRPIDISSHPRDAVAAFVYCHTSGSRCIATEIFKRPGELQLHQDVRGGLCLEWWPDEIPGWIPRWSSIKPQTGMPLSSMIDEPSPRARVDSRYEEFASGWPMLSLRMSSLRKNPSYPMFFFSSQTNGSAVIDRTGAWVIPDGWLTFSHRRELPLLPVWGGFVIDSIVYGIVLWPVAHAVFLLRGVLRRRRNLCPACAYPVGSSPVCTECGKPVTPKPVSAHAGLHGNRECS